MKTIKIEITQAQSDMIARSLYAYRMRDSLSKEESWKFEDLADKFSDIPMWGVLVDSVYSLVPEENV